MAQQIVSVWLDDTSAEHGWIVDIDVAIGGESKTVKHFPPTDEGESQAVAFAREYGARTGLPVYRNVGGSFFALES